MPIQADTPFAWCQLTNVYLHFSLQELNAHAAQLFESGNESDVAEGLSIMNDQVIPCMHLIVNHELSEEDLGAVEMMRNHWCSFLGEDMDCKSWYLSPKAGKEGKFSPFMSVFNSNILSNLSFVLHDWFSLDPGQHVGHLVEGGLVIGSQCCSFSLISMR